jgi:predicted DNA-binding transcriptional regulator AlpA
VTMRSSLLSIKEFVTYVGISRSMFTSLQRENRGPAETRIRSRVFISKEAADTWIKSLEVRA